MRRTSQRFESEAVRTLFLTLIRIVSFAVAFRTSIPKSIQLLAQLRFESNLRILDRCSRLGCTSTSHSGRWGQVRKQCQPFPRLLYRVSATNNLSSYPQKNQTNS